MGWNGIGHGSNTVRLGNTSITGFYCAVRLTTDSDARIKRDVSQSSLGLKFINALNPVTFKMKNPYDLPAEIRPPEYRDRDVDDMGPDRIMRKIRVKADPRPADNENVYLGLTAQDIETVLAAQSVDADIVKTSSRGKKGIDYSALIMPLIKSVQTLSARLQVLEGN